MADAGPTLTVVRRIRFECSWNDKTSDSESQETGCSLSNSHVEMLFNSIETSKEETHPHDQEEIRKHASNQRLLDNVNLFLGQSDDGDNQLHSIAVTVSPKTLVANRGSDSPESSIQQTAQSLSCAQGNLFGSIGQHSSQRNNSDEVDDEHAYGADIGKTDADSNGNHE